MICQCMGNVILDGNEIIYFDNQMQAICRCDLQSHRASVVAAYGPESGRAFMACQIYQAGTDYYMATAQLPAVLKYDGAAGIFQQYMPVTEEGLSNIGGFLFRENQIVLVPQEPGRYPIQIFDLKEENFKKDESLLFQLKEISQGQEINSYRIHWQKEECWGAVHGSSRYFRYRLDDQKLDLYELEEPEISLDSVACDGEYLWMTQNHTGDLICAKEGKIVKKIKLAQQDGGDQEYSWITVLEHEIAILPRRGRNIILMEKETGEPHILPIREEWMKRIPGTQSQFCCSFHQKILVLPWSLKHILMVNEQRNAISAFEMYFDIQEVYQVLAEKRVIQERSLNEIFSTNEEIEEFYRVLLSGPRKKRTAGEREQVGDKIYKMLTDGDCMTL